MCKLPIDNQHMSFMIYLQHLFENNVVNNRVPWVVSRILDV